MGHVGRRNNHRIAIALGEQFAVIVKGGRPGARQGLGGGQGAGVLVANRDDFRAVQGLQIADMLEAHHPRPDDSVSKGLAHGRGTRPVAAPLARLGDGTLDQCVAAGCVERSRRWAW